MEHASSDVMYIGEGVLELLDLLVDVLRLALVVVFCVFIE